MKHPLLHLTVIFVAVIIVASSLSTPTHTSAYTGTVTPISSPAATQPAVLSVMEWPVPAPTDEQIMQAKQCDLEMLPDDRYPQKLSIDELKDAYKVDSACDWAMLAVAYAHRVKEGEEPPAIAKAAFLKAVSLNSAIAQALPILAGYFDKVSIVKAPPSTQQTITTAKLHHKYDGIATASIDYTLTLTRINATSYKASGSLKYGDRLSTVNGTVDARKVTALNDGFTDFVPIGAKLSIINCSDDYPDWQVTLTFKDGSKLDLETNRSNILFSGGPWQIVVKKQRYMQYSAAFLRAALDLAESLKLPKDETAAMTCGGVGDTLEQAFPGKK